MHIDIIHVYFIPLLHSELWDGVLSQKLTPEICSFHTRAFLSFYCLSLACPPTASFWGVTHARCCCTWTKKSHTYKTGGVSTRVPWTKCSAQYASPQQPMSFMKLPTRQMRAPTPPMQWNKSLHSQSKHWFRLHLKCLRLKDTPHNGGCHRHFCLCQEREGHCLRETNLLGHLIIF